MSPNSNEISMQIVRNYVLKARDLVVKELFEECKQQTDNQTMDENKSQSSIRTTENWWGDNESIPLKYLVPQETVSSENILKNNPFCSHLNDTQLEELLEHSKTESIESGSIICAEGDIADKVYFILNGKVKVYNMDEKGNETELATIEKGNMFGEMALFDKGVRSASVKSIEPCQFLIFEGDTFLKLVMG
jgi:hypothetical protein